MRNTQDFAQFGNIERDEAGQLLRIFGTKNDITHITLENDLKVEFNPMSGNVFLVDGEYNVAMINDGKLENFFSCPNCGNEGFQTEFRAEHTDDCCQEYADDLGLE